jgi:hypothetical protein
MYEQMKTKSETASFSTISNDQFQHFLEHYKLSLKLVHSIEDTQRKILTSGVAMQKITKYNVKKSFKNILMIILTKRCCNQRCCK